MAKGSPDWTLTMVHKTKMKKATLSPKWTDKDKNTHTFHVGGYSDSSHTFRLEVFDWDSVGDDDYMGSTTIPFSKFLNPGVESLTLKTDEKHRTDKVSGTITIKWTFVSGKHSAPSPRTQLEGPATVVAAGTTPAPVLADSSDLQGAARNIVDYKDPEKMKTLPVDHLLNEIDKNEDVIAMLALGLKYGNGTGVQTDEKEALKWYTKAADYGNPEAQFKTGLYHLMGYGCSASDQIAFGWYTKAANQGNTSGCFGLAEMYESGWGVAISTDEAKKWYQKAAAQKDGDAQMALGRLYLADKNFAEARNFYELAAKQDFHEAFYELGRFCELGLGCAVDKAQARTWYTKASDLDQAQEALKHL